MEKAVEAAIAQPQQAEAKLISSLLVGDLVVGFHGSDDAVSLYFKKGGAIQVQAGEGVAVLSYYKLEASRKKQEDLPDVHLDWGHHGITLFRRQGILQLLVGRRMRQLFVNDMGVVISLHDRAPLLFCVLHESVLGRDVLYYDDFD